MLNATERALLASAELPCTPPVLGVEGVLVENGFERALRDARLGPIGGGTDEIMKEILGRSMGL